MTADDMQVVVLAGGLATRLGDTAHDTPKYLLPVAGRPFAHWQLARLAECGYRDVVLCIGHLGALIEQALGDGAPLHAALGIEVSIRYSRDGDQRLGTGGAIRNALPLLAPTFLLTYGDSYLPFDYAVPLRDLRAHDDALGTMAVYRNQGSFDRSNARVVDDRVVAFEGEGPFDYIDYGATAFRRRAVQLLPEGNSDLSSLQTSLAAQGVLRASPAASRFYEVGSVRGLADLDAHLREQS